jgi:hypothetical protein
MADGDREVLSSLPRTRPERRSGKRAPRTPAGASTAKNVAKPKTAKSGAKAAAPKAIPPAGYAVPKTSSPVNTSGTELIGTAIQAVGELATLGSKALRGALGRLPGA